MGTKESFLARGYYEMMLRMLPSLSLNQAPLRPSGNVSTPSTVLKLPKSNSSNVTPRSRSDAMAASKS